MNELQNLSNQFADVVAAIAPSVVQVQRVSGVVYANDVVLTNARALGREDGLHVTTDDGRTLDAELHGWDPATGLALVRASGLNAPAAKQSKDVARVGNLAIAVARSWSNAVTASAGIVSVIKVALALKHRWIPASLHFATPNPAIDFDRLRIALESERKTGSRGVRMQDLLAQLDQVASLGMQDELFLAFSCRHDRVRPRPKE